MSNDEELKRLTNTIAKGGGITFVGSVIGKGLIFISMIVLARILSTEMLGIYVLGLAILNLSSLISRLGLDTGALRFVSMYYGSDDRSKIKGTIIQSIVFSFLAGSILGVIMFFNADIISIKIFKNPELTWVIKVFSVGVPFFSSLMVAATATRGFQRMQYFVYVKELFQPGMNLFLIVLLYLVGFKLYGAVLAWVISLGLGFLLALISIVKVFPDMLRKEVRPVFEPAKMLKFSIPLLGVGFLYFLILWTDTLMLGYFRPMEEVGIYRVAAQTALLLTIFLTSSNAIFAPIIADLYNRGKNEELDRLFKITTKWTFYASFAFFIIILFSSREIMQLFGQKFIIGSGILIILAFAQFVNGSTGGVGFALIMSGRERLEFLNTFLVALSNIVLNILLIPKYGMLGAALATGISIITVNLIRLVEVSKILNIFPYDSRYFKGIIAGVLSVFTLFFIIPFTDNFHYIISLGAIVFSVVLVFIIVLITLKLDEEDSIVLKSLIK